MNPVLESSLTDSLQFPGCFSALPDNGADDVAAAAAAKKEDAFRCTVAAATFTGSETDTEVTGCFGTNGKLGAADATVVNEAAGGITTARMVAEADGLHLRFEQMGQLTALQLFR